jgi:hypothetical protein
MFSVGNVTQLQLPRSHGDARDLESSFPFREYAAGRTPDRDQRIGDRRTAVCVYDDAGYDARLLCADRRGECEAENADEPADAAK